MNNLTQIYDPKTGKIGTVPSQNLQAALSKGYEVYNKQEQQEESPSIGNRISSAAKSVVSGVAGAIPDTLAMAYNLPAGVFNYQKQNNILGIEQPYFPVAEQQLINNNENIPDLPYIPSATNAVNNTIDRATGGYTKTPEDQKYLNTALEAGAGFASGGIVSKAPGILGKVGNFVGTTKPGQIAGAGVGAALTEKQLDDGAGVGAAIGSGILANTSINALSSLNPSNFKKQLIKTGLNTIGLGKKNLNLESAKAFKDLGLGDIPKSSVSNAKSIALAEQILSKTPFAGDNIQKKYYKVGETVTNLLNQASDVIEPGTIQKIKDLSLQNRNKATELLKDTDITKPKKLLSTINKIESEAKLVASPTPQEKQVINIIEDYKKAYQEKDKVSVKSLILSQDSLGNIVDWDWAKKEKPLRWQKKIYQAFGEDIADYGKNTNPEWLNYYQKADNLYSKASKKLELEKLFDPAKNKATGELSFNNLSKILNDDKKAGKLKYLLGNDENGKNIYNKLEKLGTVARSITVKNKNIPNPSATAIVNANMQFIDKIVTGAIGAGAVFAPVQTTLSVLNAATITKLLTNEKLLDLAIKFAENPIPKTGLPLTNKVKELIGYNIISSFKEAQKQNTKEDNTIQEQEVRKPGQGLNNLMNTINNNKPIKSFLNNF